MFICDGFVWRELPLVIHVRPLRTVTSNFDKIHRKTSRTIIILMNPSHRFRIKSGTNADHVVQKLT